MKDDKKHYDPIKALRYHFSEFYIWVGFFIAINGGMLIAYSSDGLKSNNLAIKLIMILGYIASLLFYCCSKIFKLCISHISKFIEVEFDITEYAKYSRPLKYAKISTINIVSIFSFVLVSIWGILLVLNIFEDKDKLLIYCIIIIVVSITAFLCLLTYIILLFTFYNTVNKLPKHGSVEEFERILRI